MYDIITKKSAKITGTRCELLSRRILCQYSLGLSVHDDSCLCLKKKRCFVDIISFLAPNFSHLLNETFSAYIRKFVSR